MGFFDRKENEVQEEAAVVAQEEEKVVEMPKKRPFQVWEVGGERFKMKLDTSGISELEQKYKTNLMNVMGTGNGGMPALTVMLDVAHVAMRKYHHGVKRADLNDIFDRYVEEGGSQLAFYTEMYMGIFSVSGFFSDTLTNQMQDALEDAKDLM